MINLNDVFSFNNESEGEEYYNDPNKKYMLEKFSVGNNRDNWKLYRLRILNIGWFVWMPSYGNSFGFLVPDPRGVWNIFCNVKLYSFFSHELGEFSEGELKDINSIEELVK